MSEDGGVTEKWGDPDPARAWRAGVAAPERADGDAGGDSDGDSDEERWSYFPPPGAAVTPWEPPLAPALPERALAFLKVLWPHARTFGVTTAVLVLLGAPLALVWRAVAPVAVVLQTENGPQPAAPESNQMFAVDGWFVLVMLIAGSVVGAFAWLALRDRGPGAPLGLAAGGLLAAAVTAEVGKMMVVDRYLYDFCHQPDVGCIVYDGTLHLHSTPAVVVLPVALLTGFVLMTFFFDTDADADAAPASRRALEPAPLDR